MKVLFLQEFLKETHIKLEPDGGFKNVFFSTDGGKLLKQLITDKTGLGLTKKDFYIDYAFYEVPKVTKTDKWGKATHYKAVSQKEARPHFEKLKERIVREKPDIIVPSGGLGCKMLLNTTSIGSSRGVPVKVTIEGTEGVHECWVLPTYSTDYLLVNPKIQNLLEADFGTLKKFIDEGESAFVAKKVKYEDVKTIERVREIFQRTVKEAPIVTWDLETNTLQGDKKGAKPLVISICWKEGTGATIPWNHKDFMWLPGHLAELEKYIEEFVADESIIKAGHNIKFDMRFLRLTKNFTRFKNNRDTKTMYYLMVNQDVKGSLKLSDLAYEFSDIGGYDSALEDFKKQYIEDYKAKEKARIDKQKADWKEKCDEDRNKASYRIKEYKAEVSAQLKDMRAELSRAKKEVKTLEKAGTYDEAVFNKPQLIESAMEDLKKERDTKVAEMKYVKPPTPTWDEVKPPVNEIDGSDFNYEWIPLWSMLSPYASGDVDACLRIYNALASRCTKKGLAKIEALYTEHYPELSNALAKVEATGIKTDVPYIKGMVDSYTKEENRLVELLRKFPEVKQLEKEKDELYQLGVAEMMKPPGERNTAIAKYRNKLKDPEDRKFNPNSPDDKKKVLYKYTGVTLPYGNTFIVKSAIEDNVPEDQITWGDYKTDTACMEYIQNHYPEHKELMELLIEYSLVKTRKQNFTYKILAMVDHNDILHGTFNPEGTETSRLSSRDPNCQNFPRKTGDVTRFDYQHPIKRMFITRFVNGALLQLDYSSLESRIMALDAYDEEMIEAFLTGKDVHTETASLVFRKPQEEVTGDERSDAKKVTFGFELCRAIA